jgi:hypothetical protein
VAQPVGILIENIPLFHKSIAYRDNAVQVHDLHIINEPTGVEAVKRRYVQKGF